MKSSAKNTAKKNPASVSGMPLGKINYLFIAVGAAVIVLSYAVMYFERDVDGFFSLNVSPVILTAAYLWIIYAIFYRPGKNPGAQLPNRAGNESERSARP
jgi:predicted nucleotidyltransferase